MAKRSRAQRNRQHIHSKLGMRTSCVVLADRNHRQHADSNDAKQVIGQHFVLPRDRSSSRISISIWISVGVIGSVVSIGRVIIDNSLA